MVLTDEQIIAEIQQGNIPIFSELVKRYQQRLFSFLCRYFRDPQDAEDVVQETFISLYKTVERVDTKRKFSTYLFAIAKNKAISLLRSKKPMVNLAEIQEIESDTEVYEEESKSEITKALSQLEEKYRQPLKLYFFADLSYLEISRKLKIPVNTVRTNLLRGKAKLKEILNYEKN